MRKDPKPFPGALYRARDRLRIVITAIFGPMPVMAGQLACHLAIREPDASRQVQKAIATSDQPDGVQRQHDHAPGQVTDPALFDCNLALSIDVLSREAAIGTRDLQSAARD